MGHPTMHVAVMLTPDRLYGFPHLRRWYGHYRRVDASSLAYTLPYTCGSWAEGKAGGRLSLSAWRPSVTSSVKKPNISSASE